MAVKRIGAGTIALLVAGCCGWWREPALTTEACSWVAGCCSWSAR